MIVIIDYGIGNLRAISNMLFRLGFENKISRDSDMIGQAKGLILPGNGHYDACLKAFHALDILPAIKHGVFEKNVPILGICVGAQMLGHTSEEGHEKGLGWLDMDVVKFPADSDLKIPNMGWREVEVTDSGADYFHFSKSGTRFYFTHSFYMQPHDNSLKLLQSDYGLPFAAAVGRDNIIGVQFHPEKSHAYGKEFFTHFAGMSS